MSSENVDVSEEIGNEIREAQSISGKLVEDRIQHLSKAQEFLLHRDKSGSLLDNFLDEMLEFAADNDCKMRCFLLSFIENACKKDCDVMKKAVVPLSYLIDGSSSGAIVVLKKVITTCCQLYPFVLKWAAHSRSAEVERCWEAFCILKGRIMQYVDSENEGVRRQAIRFLEAVVLAQSLRTEESEKGRGDNMCLNEIGRDHRFISYRKMEREANFNFDSLLDHTSSTHITSLNLLTCVSCICNIAQLRPQFMQRVIGALESLHVNLPPTLATSQVKSVRKELKMHLLRLLKHPSSTPYQHRITTLLTDLGATQSEIYRAMPQNSESRKKGHRGTDNGDEPEKKKARGPTEIEKEEDEEYGDEAGTSGSTNDQSESAIDITAQFVHDRLTPNFVADLVLISLATLPDEMPAAFQSSYTPIAAAGTESQKWHLARMIATQLTSMELGPGVERIRFEKRQQYLARQSARMEGAIMPPTPTYQDNVDRPTERPVTSLFPPTKAPVVKAKPKIQFGLLAITKALEHEEALRLILLAFKRILSNEKRAVQGGVGVAQHKLLVRLVTRFDHDSSAEYEELLTNFIVQDQKSRTELALLWIAEMYAQFQGYSICRTSKIAETVYSEEQRFERYDLVLCNLLRTLFERGEHKETLFHKILLEAPLLTPTSLTWLQNACLDPVFGAFGMTTLRELILTRARQRNELLRILLDFSYHERSEVRTQSVETAKELYLTHYVRNDVRDYLVSAVECCTMPTPPLQFCTNLAEDTKPQWNDATIRTALNLFLSVLPLDHSLIHTLASVYAKATNDIKRVTLRAIDGAVKAMGATSVELLKMIENCPVGAETLAARMVHLLTERSSPTQDLVDRMSALYNKGRSDVRAMIPVLTGLDEQQIKDLLPTFVLNPLYQRSVPIVFQKLISSRSIKTGLHPLSASELLVALHKLKPENVDAKRALTENVNTLFDQLRESKDSIGSAIDTLIEENEISELLYHTITRAHEAFPAFGGFISNVLIKIAHKQPWKNNQSLWPPFVRTAVATAPHSYLALLTVITNDEFDDFVRLSKTEKLNIIEDLRSYIPKLSAHQQKRIDRHVRGVIMHKKMERDDKENT